MSIYDDDCPFTLKYKYSHKEPKIKVFSNNVTRRTSRAPGLDYSNTYRVPNLT